MQKTSQAVKITCSSNLEHVHEDLKRILPRMEQDYAYEYVITDKAILDFGLYLCARNNEQNLVNMTKTKLWQLSKVTVEIKKINHLIINTCCKI